MKQIIIVTASIMVSLFTTVANAQMANYTAKTNTEIPTVKNQETVNVEPEIFVVNTKVLRAFNNSFKGVEPKWFAVADKFLARFSNENGKTQVLFSKNGQMIYSVTHGKEGFLPKDLAKVVKETYPCFQVGTVTKAESMGITAWTTDIKKDNSLIILKMSEGEIVEAKEYQSGN